MFHISNQILLLIINLIQKINLKKCIEKILKLRRKFNSKKLIYVNYNMWYVFHISNQILILIINLNHHHQGLYILEMHINPGPAYYHPALHCLQPSTLLYVDIDLDIELQMPNSASLWTIRPWPTLRSDRFSSTSICPARRITPPIWPKSKEHSHLFIASPCLYLL